MPTFFIGVDVVDMPPLCCESMIAFAHEEHFPSEMYKIWVILELDIELYTGLLPKRAPGSHNCGGNHH
jgi:hypothetical protein